MTVINNIEIDNIHYETNLIKQAIINNSPIEDKLHVIMVVSNASQFASRYILAREFMQRIELEEPDVLLYIVELIYPGQKYYITDSQNPRHLQLRTVDVLWHKENMINIGVRELLPASWKAIAWIDADIEFESVSWAKDTLRVLNGTKDIVQLFSHAVDMDPAGLSMNVFNSVGYQFTKGNKYCSTGLNYWHPGYAWACSRRAYEKMGGLYDQSILGSGDQILAMSLIKNGLKAINDGSTESYKASITAFQKRTLNLRLGYIPGVIRHHFHGSKKNRQYTDRWKILVDHDFDPVKHLIYDGITGVLRPSAECPSEILVKIRDYFDSRNEDEFRETVFA